MKLITLCSWVRNGGGAIKFLGSHCQGVEAAPTAQCVLATLLDVRGMVNGPTCGMTTATCGSACGVRPAAGGEGRGEGGVQLAAGGSSNDGEGNVQAAAACVNVRQCAALLLLW
jgi:hypothetical protein